MKVRFVLLLCCVLQSMLAIAKQPALDGTWWHTASKDQRTGFLAGYIDCAVYDGKEKDLVNVSWNVVEPMVTAFYDSHSDQIHALVASVFLNVSRGQKQDSDGGEQYAGRHGIFDGEYWRQSTHDHRLGFVEGYIDCIQTVPANKAHFSRDAELYVTRLSRWYGISDQDPGILNNSRARTKIADALLRDRDQITKKVTAKAKSGGGEK